MVAASTTLSEYRRGDRVTVNGDTSGEVGIVLKVGAIVDCETGDREQLLKVVFPIASEHGTQPRWWKAGDLALRERICTLCKGEDYLDTDYGQVVCPACLGGAA